MPSTRVDMTRSRKTTGIGLSHLVSGPLRSEDHSIDSEISSHSPARPWRSIMMSMPTLNEITMHRQSKVSTPSSAPRKHTSSAAQLSLERRSSLNRHPPDRSSILIDDRYRDEYAIRASLHSRDSANSTTAQPPVVATAFDEELTTLIEGERARIASLLLAVITEEKSNKIVASAAPTIVACISMQATHKTKIVSASARSSSSNQLIIVA